MNWHDLTQKIADNQIITLYRHERPDCDAQGSQFGLKNWIEENFPGKQVHALGTGICTQGSWPASDTADDEMIRNSLAIVLDTANTERIDDRRALMAKEIIKIDHHPDHDPYGDARFVYPEAAATCQILTEWFSSETDLVLSEKTAKYLYSGLLTDTLCFRTSNTTAATLQAAAVLTQKGINIPEINRELFDSSLEEFRFETYVRSAAEIIDDKAAILVLHKEDLDAHHMPASEARNYIDQLGHIREIQVWAIFTETERDGRTVFDGSLRSKYAAVNEIAAEYNGGGHRNAAGVKNLTPAQLDKIIAKLKNAAVL